MLVIFAWRNSSKVENMFGSQSVVEEKPQPVCLIFGACLVSKHDTTTCKRYSNRDLVTGSQSGNRKIFRTGSWVHNVSLKIARKFIFWTLKKFKLLILYLMFILIKKSYYFGRSLFEANFWSLVTKIIPPHIGLDEIRGSIIFTPKPPNFI